jgi:putative ABC transport system substrate-binding protein
MRRRDFIGLLGGAAAWPLTARAQESGKVLRIGVLETISRRLNAANFDAFRNGLQDLGYVEGENIVFEYRSADGRTETFPELAAELVRLKVDVIVTRGTPAVQAAKNATSTIPIVMAASGDPLGTGVIAGLARPGANVTGLSAFTRELLGKRLEILREAVPGIGRVGYLHNLNNPVSRTQWEEFKSASHALSTEAVLLDVRMAAELGRVFQQATMLRVDALVVGNDTVTQADRGTLVALAAKHRLPAMYLAREFVDAGGLMTYGVRYSHLYRRAATFIDKIVKGASPADLPIEQPTAFELIVNLKAAKAIGLPISETFLARADEVIE